MKVSEALQKKQLLDLFRQMLLIRVFEERAAEMYTRGKVGGFLHLYIGEEAVGVGAVSVLRPDDYILTHYRDHGHALARGCDPKAVMAELFGKATGISKGKGGSMHLFDIPRGLLGGYAIVAGHLPIATGLALAQKYQGTDRVVMAIFGDGAVNEGEFYESMNLAALWKLPVLFLLENNGYGMGTPIEKAFAGKEIYHLADGYGIPARKIDGMDVLAVREATKEALDIVRSGGPYLLEARTYRFRGHSMADPVYYREKREEEQWKAQDPIERFRRYLESEGVLSEEELANMEHSVEEEIEQAIRFAEESPNPPPEALYEDIYAPSPSP